MDLEGQQKAGRAAYAVWAAIVLTAGLLRFTGLERCPDGLFRDEAEKGYNAWAIATQGGAVEFSAGADNQAVIGWNAWPFMIDVMGVKTSAIYQYAGAPFVAAMGLSVRSTRMPAAATGTLAVALLGLLLLRIWPAGAALGAMVWLAVCPWHIIFSRWALQGIFVPLGMIGVLAGAAGAERGRLWGFPLAGAALGFMFYAYSGAQPFTLAWAAGLALLYWRAIAKQPGWFALGVALLAAGAGPVVWITMGPGGAARLDAVAIWTEEGATAGSVLARFATNYAAHFSPVFLFLQGDLLPRHGIPGWGQLLMIDALLLPLGVWATFHKQMPLRGALVLAFVLGPVGAAITRLGIPHALRAMPMVVPAAVWGGVGLATAAECIVSLVERTAGSEKASTGARRRGRALAALAVAAALFFAARVFQIYWREMSAGQAAQYVFFASGRRAFEEVRDKRKPGERVWMSGAILYAPYYAMFFNELPPKETVARGLLSQGFAVYPPGPGAAERAEAMMRPGDWRIDLNLLTAQTSAMQKGS